MEIEPLFKKLENLAPHFGRAQGDIEAMISRGRGGDFKGVMQNSRLVLETLLRAMVTQELKQTPGKAMLDELITKFRQSANAGVIPTNILAHMGTVQAWGNLSSHDHAGGLHDQGVKVGSEEVATSLNSMVAILGWYAGKYSLPPTIPSPSVNGQAAAAQSQSPVKQSQSSAPTVAASAPGVPAQKGPPVVALAGVGAVLVLGAAGWFVFGRGGGTGGKTVEPGIGKLPVVENAMGTADLDAIYLTRKEPVPPAACRDDALAGALAAAAQDVDKLAALPSTRTNPEAAYLLARAQNERKLPADTALAKALECKDFAAALNLDGRVKAAARKPDDAAASLKAALEAAPGFTKARFNLGALLLQQQQITEGIGELQKVVEHDPAHADAHLLLGMAWEGQGDAAKAKSAFCTALKLGKSEAKDRCNSP